MRVAVISDVHGNIFALDAVLADIKRIGVDVIVNLGDCVSGPIDPRGAAERLMALRIPTVRGNHDRWLTDGSKLDRVDAFAEAQLSADQLKWLHDLPATEIVEDELFLCHGTPTSDDDIWLDAFWDERRTTLPDEAEVSAKANGLGFPVLLCGHTHLSRTVRLRDGRMIVNPGSVGLQLVHGSPDARYAILEQVGEDWTVCLRALPYNYEAAATKADGNGFPAWREALTSGWTAPGGMF